VQVTVRVADRDDFERIGELTLAAYRALAVDHLWGGYEHDIADTAGRAGSTEVLVASLDGEIVGSVTYVADSSSRWSEWTKPGEAQFRLLAVDTRVRHRGVGEALVRACLERASAESQPVVIHTTPWMASAQRLYERLGFTRRPDRDVPYEEWRADIDDAEALPEEWVGRAFLGYSYLPRDQESG
jgi:ribosomal protein S18 acetylase RimI-like enzyme